MTAEEHAGFWTDVRWDGPFAPLDIRGDALDNHLHGYGTFDHQRNGREPRIIASLAAQ